MPATRQSAEGLGWGTLGVRQRAGRRGQAGSEGTRNVRASLQHATHRQRPLRRTTWLLLTAAPRPSCKRGPSVGGDRRCCAVGHPGLAVVGDMKDKDRHRSGGAGRGTQALGFGRHRWQQVSTCDHCLKRHSPGRFGTFRPFLRPCRPKIPRWHAPGAAQVSGANACARCGLQTPLPAPESDADAPPALLLQPLGPPPAPRRASSTPRPTGPPSSPRRPPCRTRVSSKAADIGGEAPASAGRLP